MPYTDNEGTVVAGGKHVVPDGVAVEELDGGKKKLSEQCPEALKELLEKKGATEIYNKMVNAIVDEGNTRSLFGNWKDKEFASVLSLFADDFCDKDIEVVLCKRSAGSGTKRWLEFIDVSVVPDYVAQYDVSNNSGQVIKTIYTTLEFPYGVAVEELKQHGGRKQLVEKIPIYVGKMLKEKDLMQEYASLVEACANEGVGRRFKMWNIKKLKAVLDEHKPKFEAKGIALFLASKGEYVSHGQYGGHVEHFRWIEFVDRELQPNYYPQRDADTKNECSIM